MCHNRGPWIFKVKLSFNKRDGSKWDYLMWNTKKMSRLDAALTGGPLTLTFDLEFSRSNCIFGMGGQIVMERKGWESIVFTDVKNKGSESSGCCTDWGTFHLDLWPWIFKVKLYLGHGRPHCDGMRRTGVHRMPCCETQPLCDLEAEDSVRDYVT